MLKDTLKDLNADQARFIALLARSARAQRDALLGKAAEDDISDVQIGKGEHNPTSWLGLDPLPTTNPEAASLEEAVASLSAGARAELYILMRIGQGDLAANKWHRGLTEAENLGDAVISAAVLEDADLHDHLMKALYETKLIS